MKEEESQDQWGVGYEMAYEDGVFDCEDVFLLTFCEYLCKRKDGLPCEHRETCKPFMKFAKMAQRKIKASTGITIKEF